MPQGPRLDRPHVVRDVRLDFGGGNPDIPVVAPGNLVLGRLKGMVRRHEGAERKPRCAAVLRANEVHGLVRDVGGLMKLRGIGRYEQIARPALPPRTLRAQFEQARADAGIGRDDDALQLLGELLEREPLDGATWMLRGQIRLRQGDLAGSADDFANGVVLSPGPEALYWLGQLAEAQGDASGAMNHYEAAVAEATSPETTQFAPSLAGRLPLPVERLPCLTVLRTSQALLAPALRLGSLLEQDGRCADAAEVYRRVLAQEPYATEALERADRLPCEADGG